MDFVGDSRKEVAQELDSNGTGCPLVQLGKGKLGGTVNRHQQVQLTFLGLHLGNVEVEIADRICLEPTFLRFLGNLWQAADPMTLQAAVQR